MQRRTGSHWSSCICLNWADWNHNLLPVERLGLHRSSRAQEKKSPSNPAKSCKETVCSKNCEMPNSQLISVSFKPWDLKESSGAAAVIINIVLMESGRYWCVSGKIFSLQAFWHQDSLFLSQHPSRALLKVFSAN